MDDATLYSRMLDSMEVTYIQGLGEQIRRPGVAAFVCPSIPHRSVFNSVVYRDAEALAESLPDLTRAYDDAGVRAWTVWTPERDNAARDALAAAGHSLDATPRAMAAPISEIDVGRGAEDLDWDSADGVEEMCSILEHAFGWEPDLSAKVLDGLERDAHIYLARVDGRAAACVVTWDVAGDCGVYYVGTLPEARGRGLATGLMRQSLLDGRDRGATTTSLQATAMGRPVYQRLGYRDLGAIEMWERRRT